MTEPEYPAIWRLDHKKYVFLYWLGTSGRTSYALTFHIGDYAVAEFHKQTLCDTFLPLDMNLKVQHIPQRKGWQDTPPASGKRQTKNAEAESHSAEAADRRDESEHM
jgi:hypothetical protein